MSEWAVFNRELHPSSGRRSKRFQTFNAAVEDAMRPPRQIPVIVAHEVFLRKWRAVGYSWVTVDWLRSQLADGDERPESFTEDLGGYLNTRGVIRELFSFEVERYDREDGKLMREAGPLWCMGMRLAEADRDGDFELSQFSYIPGVFLQDHIGQRVMDE